MPYTRAGDRRTGRVLLLLPGLLLACDGSGPSEPAEPTPTQLVFQTQPSAADAGEAISPPVTVRVLDSQGNLVTGAQTTVVMSIEANPGGAGLSGTTSVVAAGGVATFSNLVLDVSGTGYTLRASAAGLTGATSDPFDITLDPLDQDNDADGFTPNQGDCDDTDPGLSPGAEDRPDPAFLDSNCDGIDGDASAATFVSTSTGSDAAGCGGQSQPCATIQTGIAEAATAGSRDVYVMAGTYDDGAVFLADGISVYGGFGASWGRSGNDTTRVLGAGGVSVYAGASEAATVVANGLTQETVVADLEIIGADATGTLTDGGGKSSYAIWVRDVPGGVLTIARNTVIGGAGAPGQAGAAGEDAPTLGATGAMNGVSGGSAQQYATACDDSNRGGGGGRGTNPAPGRPTTGGVGGHGGTMDQNCGGFLPDLDAQPGNPGFDADYTTGVAGQGGNPGAPCAPGQPGTDGIVANGAAGAGGTGGRQAGLLWAGSNGGNGGVGENGSGGGGGGGSGGCDTGTDAYGAGGGGGGAGGLRAVTGGFGGGGGGGSFGLFLVDAAPEVVDNVFVRGAGGDGGEGGIGGQGQSGGLGGNGGSAAGGAGPGGNGGDGAHGGHGGGGGGGAGGVSAAIFQNAGSDPVISGNTMSGGVAGQGGGGGPSAPSAPVPDADGNDGQPGAPGSVEPVVTGS